MLAVDGDQGRPLFLGQPLVRMAVRRLIGRISAGGAGTDPLALPG
jgi:hypothetical protein